MAAFTAPLLGSDGPFVLYDLNQSTSTSLSTSTKEEVR